MNILRYTAYTLVLVGALNWGLIGFFDFNLVEAIFGDMTLLSRIVYSTVGISAIITALMMHHCDTVQKKEGCEYGRCNF